MSLTWKLSVLYGIGLPRVSLIPRVKCTRSKNYNEYHINIAAFTGENRKSIAENLPLDATKWLDSIQSFTATVETKIKFEIYGHRPFGVRKHVAMAEKTIQDILDARDADGVVQLNLDTTNDASAAKLVLKIRCVSDGNKEEGVNQAGLPSVIGEAVDAVQTDDTLAQAERAKDAYTQHMLRLKFGLPLFTPSDVELGDVGFIARSDGSFQRLYNIAAPDTGIPGHPPPQTLSYRKPNVTEWQGIHMRANSKHKRHKIDVSARPPTAEGDVRFQFRNIRAGDVILIPGNNIRKETLRKRGEVKAYFDTHFDWIAEAYCRNLRRKIGWNELILVTGTTKTNRWAIAVNVHEEDKASLAFVVRDTGVNAWGEWSGTVGFEKCSPREVTPNDAPTETIFISCILPERLFIG